MGKEFLLIGRLVANGISTWQLKSCFLRLILDWGCFLELGVVVVVGGWTARALGLLAWLAGPRIEAHRYRCQMGMTGMEIVEEGKKRKVKGVEVLHRCSHTETDDGEFLAAIVACPSFLCVLTYADPVSGRTRELAGGRRLL